MGKRQGGHFLHATDRSPGCPSCRALVRAEPGLRQPVGVKEPLWPAGDITSASPHHIFCKVEHGMFHLLVGVRSSNSQRPNNTSEITLVSPCYQWENYNELKVQEADFS